MIVNKEVFLRLSEAAIGIVALIIGGLLYIGYRSDCLLMFDWFQNLGLSNVINSFRAETNGQSVYEWVRNSLPAGLWLFSYMFIIDSVWGKEKNHISMFFLYLLPTVAIVSELMQYIKILPGTFDMLDMLSYILAVLLYLLIKKL